MASFMTNHSGNYRLIYLGIKTGEVTPIGSIPPIGQHLANPYRSRLSPTTTLLRRSTNYGGTAVANGSGCDLDGLTLTVHLVGHLVVSASDCPTAKLGSYRAPILLSDRNHNDATGLERLVRLGERLKFSVSLERFGAQCPTTSTAGRHGGET